jgi:hypothetical protein
MHRVLNKKNMHFKISFSKAGEGSVKAPVIIVMSTSKIGGFIEIQPHAHISPMDGSSQLKARRLGNF